MPLPHVVARLNKRFTNRFIEPVVSRSPGFAVIHHTGRRTGAPYSTPVNVFDLDGALLVALTYGRRADWFRNASTRVARIERRGELRRLESVGVVDRATARPALPWFVRVALRLLRVTEFAVLHADDATPPSQRH